MSETPPPPPPPGGYDAPPPPPPGGSPGGAPGGTPGWSVGEAVSYGWAKFQANAGQIIIAGIVVLVGIAAFEVVGIVIRGILVQDPECTGNLTTGIECTKGSGFIISLLASAIMSFLFYLVFQIIGAAIIRGALNITEGKPFVVADVFKTDKIGPIVITSLLSSAIIFVGFLLCFLPGIIASFLLSFAMYFVIDQDMAPVDALKASVDLVTKNLGEALVWAIVAFVIVVVGFLACIVGSVVAIPVSLIGTAFTYKKLTGRPVAA